MPAPQADTKILSLVAEQPAPVSEVPHGIEGRPAASQPTPAAAVTPPHVAQTPAVEPVIPPQVAPAEKIQLTITSDPSGAAVEINGVAVGPTPVTAALTAGTNCTLTVKKDGFLPWTMHYPASTAGKFNLNANLTKEVFR